MIGPRSDKESFTLEVHPEAEQWLSSLIANRVHLLLNSFSLTMFFKTGVLLTLN